MDDPTKEKLQASQELVEQILKHRQTIAVRSVKYLYAVGLFLFLLFLVPTWLSANPTLAFNLEFLALLGGTLGVWLSRADKPEVGVAAIVISFGLACLFALVQFGPNLGVGFMSLAWLIAITSLQGRGMLGVALIVAATAAVGFSDVQGWTYTWHTQFDGPQWLRTSATVGIISIAVVKTINAINEELVDAWLRESVAVEERAEAERSLLQSQRLESIGKLAGGVAHDFNNSLAVLVAGIEALKNAEDESTRKALLDNMEQAARGAVATTKQLLSLSRQGLEPGQPAIPRDALGALLPNLGRLFPETIEIRSDLQDTAKIELSSGALEQVVLNLCLNARDAMPDGGWIEIACRELDEQVMVTVTDAGVGMDESVLQQADGAFFTTKRAGTGLGLSMVKETVNSVGGSVEIDSVAGVGTTITLSMPAIQTAPTEPDTSTATPGGDTEIGLDRPATVLLVEDNAMVREMYAEVLRQADYEVETAECVADALAAIDSKDFDILVTDAMLPDGEPSRAINRFRDGDWKPVLVCSGYIDSEELVKDLGQGDYSFLQKPFPNAQLTDTVRALLGASR
ncbi:MAG: ATP-binding protein [Halieaceae bacterium]